MKKQTIKLNESQLRNIIKEAILNEIGDTPKGQYALGALAASRLKGKRKGDWQEPSWKACDERDKASEQAAKLGKDDPLKAAHDAYITRSEMKDAYTNGFKSINESQLRNIIKESIKNVLNEITSTPGMGWMGLQFEEDDWIPVNEPTEGDVCMKIKLWPGQGYALDAFKAYTQPGDYEGALELLVAYLDKNGIDKYFTDTWVWDEIEELKEKGYSQDEIDSEIETWGDYYIDATGLGASKPHWLRGENLAIQQFPLN